MYAMIQIKIPPVFKEFKSKFFDTDPMKQEIALLRDWALLLSGFFLCIIIGAFIAGVVFVSVNTGEVFTLPQEPAMIRAYSEEKLDFALGILAEREERLRALLLERLRISDPSL